MGWANHDVAMGVLNSAYISEIYFYNRLHESKKAQYLPCLPLPHLHLWRRICHDLKAKLHKFRRVSVHQTQVVVEQDAGQRDLDFVMDEEATRADRLAHAESELVGAARHHGCRRGALLAEPQKTETVEAACIVAIDCRVPHA